MKTFKLVFFGVVLAVIGSFIWQNIAVFKTTLPFSFNYYIQQPLAWTHSLYTILIFTGVLGFLLGILVMLKPYFNARRRLSQERTERQQGQGQRLEAGEQEAPLQKAAQPPPPPEPTTPTSTSTSASQETGQAADTAKG